MSSTLGAGGGKRTVMSILELLKLSVDTSLSIEESHATYVSSDVI